MGVLKRIHVNRQRIAQNKKLKRKKPVITIKTSKENTYCKEAIIDGPSKLVYSPNKPLNCGAVLWVETRSRVFADGKIISSDRKKVIT